MSPVRRSGVTLQTLHQDLGAVKVLLTTGLRAFPQDWSGDVLRTLRENNRLSEARFAQLDVALREQSLETHTILRAVADGQRQIVDSQRDLAESQRLLVEGQRLLVEGQHQLVEEQRQLSADMRALIARIDALIRGRGNGAPTD
jgi:hypothetical protein